MLFTILLAGILIVAIYGIVSSEKGTKRVQQNLARAMATVGFSSEACCKCAMREDCQIYLQATGLTGENDRSYRFE